MGTNIIITKPNGDRVPMESRRTATSITAAKQTWALNAEDTIAITVVSPFPQSYGIGDAITVFGRDYRLNRLPKVRKTGFAEYQYDLEFEGIQYDLLRVTYDVNINTTNNELQDIQGDSLTGDLKTFMDVLISNANRVFPGKWALGVCPETDGDNTLTFSESDNCLSVLQTLCSTDNFGVEFDIAKVDGVYTINLYEKVGSVLPFTLEYGKGKGLYSINRDNVASSNIITRLKVFGSTENITSKYRADRLCMFGKDKSSSYIEKAEAVAKYGIFEGRKNFDDIKPTHKGEITAIVDGDVLSFIDETFPFDIKKKNPDGETEYMIPGVSPKVHFNSGNLAGYEFEVHDYDHVTHKFTLIKQTDDRGNTFPSKKSPAFQFAKHDTYKVLDIAYSPEIEEAAEKQLTEQGNKYYDENCQPKVQYSIEVTKSFVEKYFGGSDGVVNVFKPGDCLQIKDDEIGVDKAIRIKSFTRNVLDPYDYALTISDVSTKADIITRVISEIGNIDKVIDINNLKDPAQARANWRSSREVLNMVFDPETGGYYGDKITPASVDTIALSVGAKSMQFGLTNTVFQPNFNGNSQVVKWKGGVLTHYTIDPDTSRSWALADGEITLTDNDPYYIYARCNRNGEDGVFEFSKAQHKCEESATVYYFLIGVLNSVDAETKVRSIALTYGFTMINGRFIKTGRIESADGTTYFDLDNSEIGGRIVFTSNGKEKTLEELGAEALESKDYINNTLPGLLSALEAQIDGKIETWFSDKDPSTEWKTSEERKKHVGDLWYNTKTNEAKRYSVSLAWEVIKDADALKALQDASKAQDTADGKRRVFVDTPTTPYDRGDLWASGAFLKRSMRTRLTGAMVESDWEDATNYTGDESLNDFIQNTYNSAIADIYGQLDGVIETHFGNGAPTLSNAPASEWTTDKDKEEHLGDMYYDNDSGIAYRFSKDNGVYKWVEVRDTGVAEALAAAAKAQDTADGKRRVFVDTPRAPYDVGDLWANGTFLKRCIVSRASGGSIIFQASDWGFATNYTGDENLNAFIDGVFGDTISAIYKQIDGMLESWYTTTDPASNWTTDEEKAKHVGDQWFNTSANRLFHYIKSNGIYIWEEIKNQDALDAAITASKAQDTADGKRRVFVTTPKPPYDVGDLWTDGNTGDLLVCIKERQTGEHSSSDWGKATKYTDDAELKKFINSTYNRAMADIERQLDGKIETWFTAADPSQAWTTVQKQSHVGDMWYNTADRTLHYYDNTLQWLMVENATAIAAYETAANAKDTADGKRRVFVTTPKPPYDVGDLWTDGNTGDLLVCIKERQTGEHSSSDWGKATKYTDDAELKKFINSTYNRAMADIERQLDGKIETWFTAADPSQAWTTVQKQSHVGDMWYNTADRTLHYYDNTLQWLMVENATAIAAYETAANAKDTADGKRRVFVTTPKPPYDVGDLWVDGKELRRCITARPQGQYYNVLDWVIAVYYDNTQTTIDGGIVTSGTIQVAGDNASILAGMTGQGTADDAIRFWAGASFENRATAPFRVQQNGKAIATNLHISEESTFAGELKGASGSFYGIVKISLLYNAVKNLSQATYYVDPENEPFNWFVYNNPTIDTRLYLPDANKYDGMEISVFIVYTGSQWSVATYNYVSPTNGNKLLCMQNIYNHNLSTTDFAIMRKYNAPYKGDTSGWRILFNTLYRFKAMGGHWYAIDGIFTGE